MRNVLCLTLLLLISGTACKDSVSPEEDVRTFRFTTTGDETFIARTSDPALIQALEAQLALPLAERTLHINGKIAAGTDGNLTWSWHFIPDQWQLAEMSIELCDGRPSDVEADLTYWLGTVGQFCPWSARVLEEVDG